MWTSFPTGREFVGLIWRVQVRRPELPLPLRFGALRLDRSLRAVDLDWWQMPYLGLGEAQSYAVIDACDCVDRNGDPLLPPQVALVEQDMRHVLIAGIDDHSLDSADGAIGGVHVLTTAQLHLPYRDPVGDDDRM